MSERVEGLPLDLFLGVACRLTGADRRMLIAAGETLADLPAVSTLFVEGGLSWGQVRAITTAAKRLSADGRAVLDARVAASAADAVDPDDLVWAVQAAADELRAPARWSGPGAPPRVQLRVGPSGVGWWCAAVRRVRRGHRRADPERPGRRRRPTNPHSGARSAATADDVADGGDGQAPGSWSAGSRSRQYATAMARIAADWLGGDTRRPARPLLIAHVQVADLTAGPAGTVELNVRGRCRA